MPLPDPKRVPFRSEAYLEFHRGQRCHLWQPRCLRVVVPRFVSIARLRLRCARLPDRTRVEPSHVKARRRFGDEWVVPHCPLHHEQFHQFGKEAFEEIYGVDLEMLAMKYWNLWHGDFAMFAEVG